MTGHIVSIFTSALAGEPMQSVPQVQLQPGAGVLGDRYATGQGTFFKQAAVRPDAEVTLIEAEEVSRFNESFELSIGAGEFRRNIVTQGVRLNTLVGQQFRVGDAVLEGVRLCEPCAHLAKLLTAKVLPGMVHRAGLRARVLHGAIIRPGDTIAAAAEGASDV